MILGAIIICFYLGSVWLTRCYMVWGMKTRKWWYAPETWWLPFFNLLLVFIMIIRFTDLSKNKIYQWWTGGH